MWRTSSGKSVYLARGLTLLKIGNKNVVVDSSKFGETALSTPEKSIKSM